jgi:hypothetical protein
VTRDFVLGDLGDLDDQRGVFEYYKVTAEPGEDAVVVKIAKVAENEVPSHLKAALR